MRAADELRNRDAGLIDLAVKRGLLSAERAAAIQASLGGRPAAVALVEEGQVPAHAVRALRAEQRRNSIPAEIGGWRIVSHLGNGGMSVVFRAVDAGGREAAIKLLSPRVAGDGTSASRFLREIRAAFAIDHPNVIRSFDSGEVNGRPWIVQEYMAGGDCERLLARRGGPLPEAEALRIAAQCARGLTAIHAAGLLHRDVKPANVFLAADGSAKLADLGLARQMSGEDQLTMAGVRVGTPVYMAPEQARGGDGLDARCDIYALGATLFHLVTGMRPFSGVSHIELLMAVASAPRPDPAAVNPALSPGTAAVIRRAMRIDRAQRYVDAAAMAEDIEAVMAGRTPAGAAAAVGPGSGGWLARLLARLFRRRGR